MKLKTFAIACALAVAIFLFAQRRTVPPEQPLFRSVVDLTHRIDQNPSARERPSEASYQMRNVKASTEPDGFARELHLPEHFATHIDAPAEFAAGRWSADQIPAERLVRPLVVLDVTAKVSSNPDYRVSVDDIAAWEQANGHIPAGALVMAYTGWEQRWGSMQRYRNADADGVMHFPGFTLEATRFLVEGRDVVGLGIDTPSVDFGPSREFPVHRYSAEHSVYHLENVANLELVPPVGALVVVSPAKMEGVAGGPARVLALLVNAPQERR